MLGGACFGCGCPTTSGLVVLFLTVCPHFCLWFVGVVLRECAELSERFFPHKTGTPEDVVSGELCEEREQTTPLPSIPALDRSVNALVFGPRKSTALLGGHVS